MGGPEALEACLVHAPLSVSHVVDDGTYTHMTCANWSLSNWNRTKTAPGLCPLKGLNSLCQGASSRAQQKRQPDHSEGWAVASRPSPDPCLFPLPWLPSAEQGQTQVPTHRGRLRTGLGLGPCSQQSK